MAPEDRVPDGIHPSEIAEWLESLEDILYRYGPGPAGQLLGRLEDHARRNGVVLPFRMNTPYVNSIPAEQQPDYPGDVNLERRLKSLIRWNALAMVVRANREYPGIGGHISTYASVATLFEVAFQHFLRGRGHPSGGDFVYFQGHASPGVYARAFLEGRLSEEQLHHFRRETGEAPGLSSYPHPWLMPDFWEFPTVSMGLSSLMAIYQARFNHYLQDRGIKDTSGQHVWCFLGDGEIDEPESLGSIALASREKLDNLTFVINCNLQRLDGPVRGNGKIIQELETVFRGAGWNVIKVIWGREWDPLLEADEHGLLVERMNEVVDGEYQKYVVESGGYIRQHFFGKSPELLRLVEHLSDEQLKKLSWGGHDPGKVYAAYRAALDHQGAPTVILAKTIKGYGLGEAGEGRNVTHQQKKLNEEELQAFRSRFDIPLAAEKVEQAPFYRPPEDAPEMRYLHHRREELGGFVPARSEKAPSLETPSLEAFADFLRGSGDREVATIMAFVRMLGRLLRDKHIGRYLVPIIPDEARTFGMDVLFRQCGIYSHAGQLYEPVDIHTLLYYREARDGQLLEEGITEAGSACSFIAAGTAAASHGVPMIPFFSFYSMFGFQRIGDLLWAAADARSRGFLLGGIAGRTTLAGEGLQHQDGHSHLLAATIPNLVAYDPAYAYEFAVILQDGLRRMYQEGEAIFYYITMYNEKYPQPAMPEDTAEGIRKGMYRLRRVAGKEDRAGSRPQLLGSGSLLREVLRAQDILAERFGVGSDVWSVTSYQELRRDALALERWNRLHPEEPPRRCYVQQCLEEGAKTGDTGASARGAGPVVATSDYLRLVCEQIAPWVPGKLWSLGTDGFGRSDTRAALRRHFEVDAEHIAFTALRALAAGRGQPGKGEPGASASGGKRLRKAMKELGINQDKKDPVFA